MKTILLCLLSTIILSQTTRAQQTAKIYSGPFGRGIGTATYGYIPADDGSRIFDGKFTYKVGAITLTGNFKNDLQVGKWTLTDAHKDTFVKTHLKTVYTFTFDNNGLLTGPASKEVFFRNGTRITSESCNFDEGRLDGPFNATDWHNKKKHVEGQYLQNKRVGKWKFYYNSCEPITVNYDMMKGNYPQIIQYDPTTGDTITKYDFVSGDQFDWWWLDNISLANRLRYRDNASLTINEIELLYRNSVFASDNSFNDLDKYLNRGIGYYNFILNNTSLTSNDYVPGVSVSARCIVDKDGTISDVRILESVNEKVDTDAERLIRSAPITITPLDPYNSSLGRCEPVRSLVYVRVSYPEELKVKLIEKEKALEEKALEMAKATQPKQPVYHLNEVDTPPILDGGRLFAIDKYLKNKINYPSRAAENGIQGRVTVRCIVRADGKIDELSVIKGKSPDLDKEAIRVVKSLPKLKPATKDNEPVDVEYTIIVPFVLN